MQNRQWEVAVLHREPSLELCDDREQRDGRRAGRLKKEGRYTYKGLVLRSWMETSKLLDGLAR